MTDQMTPEAEKAVQVLFKRFNQNCTREECPCCAPLSTNDIDIIRDILKAQRAQAAAEALKERDAALAQCAMLREALLDCDTENEDYGEVIHVYDPDKYDALEKALTATHADVEAFVQSKVEEGIKGYAQDAKRYRRLRVLGCAPSTSPLLDDGFVLCFTNLDKFVDDDLLRIPSRGEYKAPAEQAEGTVKP